MLEYWNAFQQKIDVLFNKHQLVPLAEAKELGMKDPERYACEQIVSIKYKVIDSNDW